MSENMSSSVSTSVMNEDERRKLLSKLATEMMQCTSSVGINWGYKIVLLLAAIVMLLLPAVYVLMIVGVAYACYLHAVHDVGMLQSVRGRGIILVFALYVTPMIAGAIAIFFMVKPLFARRRYTSSELKLERNEEPVFFEVVDILCKALKAPRPSQIMVDCTANASASFGSVWNLFSGKLTLTVGLPLVANLSTKELLGVLAHEFGHFAQGGGTRITYFIRRVSGWFERIVYERDEWDYWLEVQKSDASSWLIQLIFAFSQFMVWLSRKVLFCLMIVGHFVSSFMLRRMEYDADTYQVRLVGAEVAAETLRKIIVLSESNSAAFDSLPKAWRDRRMPDDFIAHTMGFHGMWNEQKKSEFYKAVSEAKTGLFSTHPSPTQRRDEALRFQKAKALKPEGVIGTVAPASVLFADMEERSKMATLALYYGKLGSELKPEFLVPVAEKAEETRVENEGYEAVSRFFQGAICTIRMCYFTPGAWIEKKSADDVAGEIFGLRQEIRDLSEKIAKEKSDLTPLMGQFEKCHYTRGAVLVGANKTQIEKAGLIPLESADIASVKWLENQNTKEIEKKAVHIQSAGELGMKRLMLCLSADQTDREQIQPYLQAMAGLKSVYTLVRSMDETLMHLRGAMTIVGNKAVTENQAEAVISICQKGISLANEMRSLLGDTPFPFAHGSGKKQIRSVIVPSQMPSKHEVGSVGSMMESVISDYFQIYLQTLSVICLQAQRFESELGLDPLELPVSNQDKQPTLTAQP